MKKRLFVFLLLLPLLCVLSGCAREDGVPMELTVVRESVTPTGLTYRVRLTGSGKSWGFGYEYTIDRWENGGWTPVPYAESGTEYAFNAVGLLAPENGDAKEFGADWSMLYGELPPGRYRIGKRFDPPHGSGREEVALLYAEFAIGE